MRYPVMHLIICRPCFSSYRLPLWCFIISWNQEDYRQRKTLSESTIWQSCIIPITLMPGPVKLNSYLNASVFLSLCRMRISLSRMRILVCEVAKLKRACEKAMKKTLALLVWIPLKWVQKYIQYTVQFASVWLWHHRGWNTEPTHPLKQLEVRLVAFWKSWVCRMTTHSLWSLLKSCFAAALLII